MVLAQGNTVEEEVRETMADGGIYVISAADEVRVLTQGPCRTGRHWRRAVVATDSASANADYDNGAAFHSTCGSRRGDERATRRLVCTLACDARPARRRRRRSGA